MINSADYQAVLIAALKASPTVSGTFGAEIREEGWTGTDFTYPALRISVDNFEKEPIDNCNHYTATFRTIVYSEKDSSLEVQNAAHVVNVFLEDRILTHSTFNGMKIRPLNARPRIPDQQSGIRHWIAETSWVQYITEK